MNKIKGWACIILTVALFYVPMLFIKTLPTEVVATCWLLAIVPMFRHGYYRELEMRDENPEAYKLHRYFMDRNL